jgi:endonuclease I
MKKVLLLLLIPFIISYSQIQISVGSSKSESFSIGTSATATMPTGWKVDKNTSVRTVGTYSAAVSVTDRIGGNNIISTAGNGIYNFGLGDEASATDRAVGGLSSGSASKSVNVYAYFHNNGTSTIKRFDVSYDVYRFRNGSNTSGFTMQLYYSMDGATWTSAGANFTSSFAPNADTYGGTVPLETKKITNQSITGLNIASGGSLYLAWNYSVTSPGTSTSSSQALGIDNFVINNILDTDTVPAPSAPTALAATNVLTSGFTANWNTSAGATGYYLDVSTSSAFSSFVTDYNNKNVGNVASYTVAGLTEKTKYYYRVRAFNSSGTSGNSSIITVTTDSLITSIQFTGIANTVAKSKGSYELTLSITNPSNTSATTCVVSLLSDSCYANILSIMPYTSTTVTFPAGSSANQKITLTLVNDGVSERSRRAYFLISNVSGGMNAASKVGSQPYFKLSIMSGRDNAYYNTINTNLTGSALKTALYSLIKGHTQYPYTASTTDVWNILQDADEDPTNPDNVLCIYSGISMYKYNTNLGLWNREHIWSKSHGNFGTEIGAGTDAHHLRAANPAINTLKSNLDYDNGGNAVLNGNGCLYDADSWEPRDAVKGDIARMIFYMATRYQGENGEPNLSVVDYVNTSPNNEPLYGKLSTLLQWNIQDPVDDNEMNRNNIVYTYQHNRNPYIDHPEWITSIWGGPTTAVPAAPVAAAASNISVSGFTANWSASATATGYYLYVATDNTFSNVLSSYNGKDVGNVTTFNVTGLDASTYYFYRLKAYNLGGPSGYSNIIPVLTLINVPAAPVAIAATIIDNSSFSANWNASPTATGYYLDVATDAGFTSYVNGYNGKDVENVLTYTVSGVNYNTNYYYRVRAYNTSGSGFSSNSINVFIIVGIEDNAVPSNYYLFQNYPNPFNPSTMIKFSLKKGSAVKIMLYDITGRAVETLVNTQYSAGTHSVRFDASNLANGIYFYRIVTDEFSDIKKMVLMK